MLVVKKICSDVDCAIRGEKDIANPNWIGVLSSSPYDPPVLYSLGPSLRNPPVIQTTFLAIMYPVLFIVQRRM